MVLLELGNQITDAIGKWANKPCLGQAEAYKKLIGDLTRVLLFADVNVRLVASFRNSVQKKVLDPNIPPGTNKEKLIRRVVVEELTNMLDSDKKPQVPVRGKTNVIMLVGTKLLAMKIF